MLMNRKFEDFKMKNKKTDAANIRCEQKYLDSTNTDILSEHNSNESNSGKQIEDYNKYINNKSKFIKLLLNDRIFLQFQNGRGGLCR
jgi:hypothetical protein